MAPSIQQRNHHYTLLNVGKKQLGWDDDFYRNDFLVRFGATTIEGRVSASTLDDYHLRKAVQEMMRLGFRPKKKTGSESLSDWRTPRIAKITALWCTLADAGVVKDRSEKAMQKWCSTLTHKPVLKWATSDGLNRCIEALKNWADREHVKIER